MFIEKCWFELLQPNQQLAEIKVRIVYLSKRKRETDLIFTKFGETESVNKMQQRALEHKIINNHMLFHAE